MSAKRLRFFILLFTFMLFSGVALAAVAVTEQEPNNTPAQANHLDYYAPMEGAIDPVGDADYFRVKGVNDYWGMVAFLDTEASTASQQGLITAYAPDGVTVLQQDRAASGKKAVIAWQHFSGGDEHFLRVNEVGDDQTISQYALRYYELSIGQPGAEQPEQEPNNTLATANASARVNRGVIDSATDTDCYAVYAKPDQKFLFALNADPEGDGGADFILDFYKPDGSLWRQADRAGAGGNEYIDELIIPAEGVYAYCVRAKSSAGANATYLSGPVRDGRGYEPSFEFKIHWDNPRPGQFARVGEEMRYTVNFTHTSPLSVPDIFKLHIYYHPECQSIVDSSQPDYQYGDAFGWRYDGITPNMAVTKTFVMRAKVPCVNGINLDVVSDYYDTAWGNNAYYIIGDGLYLPLALK